MSCTDILFVKQEDGSFKSSPFYVYFQKRKKKVDVKISIKVNENDTGVEMLLKGKERCAFFPETIPDFLKKYEKGDLVEEAQNLTRKQLLEICTSEAKKRLGIKAKVKEKVRQSIKDWKFFPFECLTPPHETIQKIVDSFGDKQDDVSIEFTNTLTGETTKAMIFVYNSSFKKLIISDIDGTITKSDVRGIIATTQLKSFGYGYTKDRVCSLFENLSKGGGYRFIYFTCRSIRLYQKTRSYIDEVQQDGINLPRGPVIPVMSNLKSCVAVPILQMEMTFKLDSLNVIKSLFGCGCENNPFFAGFGNTERDLEAYTSAGVKNTFIINKKDEIKLYSGVKVIKGGYGDIEGKNLHLFGCEK